MTNYSIYNDFKQNWLFLSILFIGCIPGILSGYSLYLLVFLLIIIFIQSNVRFSTGIFLSLLFGFSYTFPLLFHETETNASAIIFTLLYPALFYLIPQYLFTRLKNRNSIFIITFIIITCIASWSIFLNISDFLKTGQIISLARFGVKSSIDGISATSQNMMLSLCMAGVGMIFVKPNDKLKKRLKYIIIIAGFLAFFSAIHLLNRTAIVLVIISCLVGAFFRGLSPKNLLYLVIAVLVISFIYFFFIDGTLWFEEIIEGFTYRQNQDEGSFFGGNGRDKRMIAALLQIPEYPFGYHQLIFGKDGSYAHNTWLDCGIQSGWIAMFILIGITLLIFKRAYEVIFFDKNTSIYWKSYIAMVLAVMIVQLAVEPGIQGVLIVFLMLFYFWSMLDGLKSRISNHNYQKITTKINIDLNTTI